MSENNFNILNQKEVPSYANEITLETQNQDVVQQIKAIIGSDKIVLFMKGNAHFPECGFSANTIQILDSFASKYSTFNILSSPEVRQGIKEYSNWPTFPQLYVNNKLIGGNDIITEMFQAGDLTKIINE